MTRAGLDAARRARAAGDLDAARRHCAQHLAAAPKDAAAQHLMATLAAEAGAFDLALAHARKARKLAPRAYAARLDLARILLLSGKESAALAESDAALALRPDDPAARFEHAKILYNSTRIEAAEAALAAIVVDRPDLAEAQAMLAAHRMTLGRAEGALASADAALALGLDAPELHEIRGKALLTLDRTADAHAAFRHAVALAPRRLSALRGLSIAARAAGDAEEARTAFLRHVRLQLFEKRGDDRAPVRMLVAEDFGRGHSFKDLSLSRFYSGFNFVSDFEHPKIQCLHYLADYADPRNIAGQVGGAHLLFNNIANAELVGLIGGGEKLAKSFEETGLPVVNPVEKVLETTREANYRRFRGDPRFRFPKTVRFEVGDDPARAAGRMLEEFEPPFLVRPVHTNVRGGLRLIHHPRELLEGEKRLTPGPSYAIEYLACTRKSVATGESAAFHYRAAVVGGRIFPAQITFTFGDFTHGSIDRTVMDYDRHGASDVERAFLARPEDFAGAPLTEIFASVLDRIGLDLYGIDFGVRDDGEIVVFEVNAAMVLFNKHHHKYSPYLVEPRRVFSERVAEHLLSRAGH